MTKKAASSENGLKTVTVLDDLADERNDFHKLASLALADAYDEDEIEYTEADIKE